MRSPDIIWGLLHALKRLPPSPEQLLYRGCRGSLGSFGAQYEDGQEVTWYAFSSCSATLSPQQYFTGTAAWETVATSTVCKGSFILIWPTIPHKTPKAPYAQEISFIEPGSYFFLAGWSVENSVDWWPDQSPWATASRVSVLSASRLCMSENDGSAD